jgi:hypothetical protein
MERKPAVAVVFHHIGPYHHARLNAATDKLSVIGFEWSAKGSAACFFLDEFDLQY